MNNCDIWVQSTVCKQRRNRYNPVERIPYDTGFDSRAGRYEDGLYILKCLAPVHLAVSRYGMLVGGCVLAFPGELREEVSGLVKDGLI